MMLIKDHINLLWGNPLVGPNDPVLGPKFVDMTDAYSPRIRAIARRIAANNEITLQEGVYIANIGPTFATPAETMMAYRLGGDLVGMSSVPDVIVARHMGMEVMGLSQVGNRAAGLHQGFLGDADGSLEITLDENFANLLWNVLVRDLVGNEMTKLTTENIREEIREETYRTLHIMRVASGKEPPDLLLKNCRVVNVYTDEIVQADIAIAYDRIAAVRPGIEATE